MPIPTTKWGLPTLLNSNARSIVNKIDMTEIIENIIVDIASVTESWLSEEIPPCVTFSDHVTKRFEYFISSMALLINQHLPTRRVRRHISDKSWVTDYFPKSFDNYSGLSWLVNFL